MKANTLSVIESAPQGILSGMGTRGSRIREIRKQSGLTQIEFAHRLGVSRGAVGNWERGLGIDRENMARIAAKFGSSLDWLETGGDEPMNRSGRTDFVPPPVLPEYTEIRIIGRVAAGVFREVEPVVPSEAFPLSPFPPDPRYPLAAQFDLIVEGESINRFARDGDCLRCVDIHVTDVVVVDGDMAVIRRIRGGSVETTAKRVRRRADGRWEAWYDSDDERYQGVVPLDAKAGDVVEVTAVVLYAYRPARPLAARP